MLYKSKRDKYIKLFFPLSDLHWVQPSVSMINPAYGGEQQFMLPVIRKCLNDLINVPLHDSVGIWENKLFLLIAGKLMADLKGEHPAPPPNISNLRYMEIILLSVKQNRVNDWCTSSCFWLHLPLLVSCIKYKFAIISVINSQVYCCK